jgi:hypothetical protein
MNAFKAPRFKSDGPTTGASALDLAHQGVCVGVVRVGLPAVGVEFSGGGLVVPAGVPVDREAAVVEGCAECVRGVVERVVFAGGGDVDGEHRAEVDLPDPLEMWQAEVVERAVGQVDGGFRCARPR